MILVGFVTLVGLFLFVAPSWISAPVAWLLLGYLLSRAWPGVREDLGMVRRARLPLPGRRRRGGAFL